MDNLPVRTFNGHTPTLGAGVYVDRCALVLGDVVIGADSSVWPMAVVRGDMHRIRIGMRTSIQDGAVLHITHAGPYNPDGYPLTIGNEVTVGHNATLHGCTLQDCCLIGNGAVVLDGAVVEERVIVAAGALVAPNQRLENGFVYKGNPARKSRPLTPRELEYLSYSADNYVRLKQAHLDEQRQGNRANRSVNTGVS